MGRDESGTLARLKAHRSERLEPALARNGGRLVKLTGDGALAEFGSAVDALRAAIEFQQSVAEANRNQSEDTRIVFRIGLHLGDLIVDGDDLYEDGVMLQRGWRSKRRRVASWSPATSTMPLPASSRLRFTILVNCRLRTSNARYRRFGLNGVRRTGLGPK